MNQIAWQKSRFHKRLRRVQDFADAQMRTIVVDGSSNFWTSNWMGSGSLRDSSLGLQNPNLTLAVAFSGGGWQQHLFQMDVSDAELQQILAHNFDFLTASDFLVWKATSSGIFSISSAYEGLRATQALKPFMVNVWSKHIPLKVSVFFWRLFNGWLPLYDILQRMGFAIVSKCPHCCQSDSVHHAFVTCSVSQQLWHFVSDRFNILLPLYTDLWSIIHTCWSDFSAISQLIRLLPAAVCWTIWKLRTSTLYGDPFKFHSIPLLMETLMQFTHLHPLKSLPSSTQLYHSLGLRTLSLRRIVKVATMEFTFNL